MEARRTINKECPRCKETFVTDAQHPSNYCSIACEEGRSPLPMDNPASDGYHLHLQAEPESLIGKTVVANCLKRTCYSPDWHRSPSDYNSRSIVSHDSDKEVLVYKTDSVVGEVTDYENGRYRISRTVDEPVEGVVSKWVDASMVVSQIRQERWWAE